MSVYSDFPRPAGFRHTALFWLGTVLVAIGVVTHLPMYWMGRANGFVLSGMEMDLSMMVGMALIPAGIAMAFVGLVPERTLPRGVVPPVHDIIDGDRLKATHWKVVLALLVAVTVDVMKPATLGFVIPGIREEYGLERNAASLVPLAGLIGTAIGSIIWGRLGDVIGRRGSILLSFLMFIGTSICGAMPLFGWNVVMCFLMGLSAGGMLPIAFALTSEMLPARHRGWILVTLGGIGTAAGYLVASGAAAMLEPTFSWRSLWLIGFPTGALVLLLQPYIPESPRFLARIGAREQAEATLRRFGGRFADSPDGGTEDTGGPAAAPVPAIRLLTGPYGALALAMVGTGLAWGLVNIRFLLWLPTTLESLGMPREAVSRLLVMSGILALPGVLIVIPLYSRWSSFRTVALFTILTAAGIVGFALFAASGGTLTITASVALVLIASSGVIATLIPYASEVFPLALRSTCTGLVAGSSKFGGIMGVVAGAYGLFDNMMLAATLLVVLLVGSAVLLLRAGIDTRGRTLEDIQSEVMRRALP